MIHLRESSPFRPVDWRWEKATLLRREGRAASRSRDDEFVARARQYQAERERATGDWDHLALAERWPALTDAYEFKFRATSQYRTELESRLLTGVGAERVAEKMGLATDVVRWYEALFFHVTDRLLNTSWIAHCVIGPALHENLSDRDFEILWKLLGWAMGEFVVDMLVGVLVNPSRPTTPDGVRSAVASQARAQLDKKTLMSMLTLRTNDPLAKLQLVEMQARFQELERAASGGASGELLKDNLAASLGALPWGIGQAGLVGSRARVRVLGRIDVIESGASEPRACELLGRRVGASLPDVDEAAGLAFPAKMSRVEAAS